MIPSTLPAQENVEIPFPGRILAGIAEDDAVAVLARLFFNGAHAGSKKGIGDIRDNYPNYPAFTGPEAARHRIGFVIQLFNGLIDPGGDFGTDVSGLVDHMGDS